MDIAKQLIDALETVHFAGRIYNDLKPENIMVDEDENGKLHMILIDFGYSSEYVTT